DSIPSGATVELDFAAWPEPVPLQPVVEYRLLPNERKWRAAPTGTAQYAKLAAGQYRLEMRAGASGRIAVYQFSVVPGLMAWWWIPAGSFSGAAGVWYWRRYRVKTEYWKAKRAFLARAGAHDEPECRTGVVAGRYSLRMQIGEGGFASVSRAMDMETGIEVAVKVLHGAGELEEHQRTRFEKETEALRRIEHPGVVRLLDAGSLPEGELYLVMRYVEGPTLRAILGSGPIGRIRAAQWLLQLGAALGEAHSRGVLHRDLKPENIIIEHCGPPEANVGVADAGWVQVTSLMLGSLHYLAPERVQGRSSAASDVYALTAVAFEMLTGVRYSSLADGTEAGLRRALAGFEREVVAVLAAGLS